MTDLIKVTESNGKQVVSARELHQFLDVGSHFKDWMPRMFEYGFQELTDYQAVLFFEQHSNGIGGTNKKEYLLTIDCAKQIAMIQRSDKGRQAREYFLDCEKRLMSNQLPSIPQTFAEALRLAADKAEKLEKAELKIEEDKPKVIFAEALVTSSSSCLVGELAKILNQNGVEIGQNRLFDELRSQGYLGIKGAYWNIPMQKYMDLKFFEIRKGFRKGKSGEQIVTTTTLVTGKGQQYFINKFLQENTLKLK